MCVFGGFKETKKQIKNKGLVGYLSVLPQVCQIKISILFFFIRLYDPFLLPDALNHVIHVLILKKKEGFKRKQTASRVIHAQVRGRDHVQYKYMYDMI